jgi:hypothetical protein
MIKIAISSVLLGLCQPTFAGNKDEPELDDGRPVSARILPGLEIPERAVVGPTLEMVEVDGKKYPPVVVLAAEALDMEPEYAHRIRQGLEIVYLRDYKAARKHFAALDADFPGTGISATVNALLWQACTTTGVPSSPSPRR